MRSVKELLKTAISTREDNRATLSRAQNRCHECEGTGWVIVRSESQFDSARPCVCQTERRAKRIMRCVGRQFKDASFETFKPQDEAQRKALERMTTDPERSYFITGSYGRGKTHLLIAQYKVVAFLKASELRDSHELMDELRNMELDADFRSPVMVKVDFWDDFHLFWDDLDKIRPTPFRDEMIFHLVNKLYSNRMKISITSNLTLQTIADLGILHPGAVRRINDMCQGEVIQL